MKGSKEYEFVNESKIINIYSKNSLAHSIANEYYQEIHNFLAKNLEKVLQKGGRKRLTRRQNFKSVLEEKKNNF